MVRELEGIVGNFLMAVVVISGGSQIIRSVLGVGSIAFPAAAAYDVPWIGRDAIVSDLKDFEF